MNNDIFERNIPGLTEKLALKTVAIAGLGGIGSNAAVALTRSGIGTLILVDFDKVEASNLNRQHYFQSDIGKEKTEALKTHLKAINPNLNIVSHQEKIVPGSVSKLLGDADLLIEAFDSAHSKKWLIESWCKEFPKKPIICASGISGVGKSEELTISKSGNIIFCGDGKSDMSIGLSSSRVGIVANMQANIALELLSADS